MKIEHIAIWTPDIEALCSFYCRHFGCSAGPRYENRSKRFASYFLQFAEGTRIEIMQKIGIEGRVPQETHGLAHFAISVGSEDEVRAVTDRSRMNGAPVVSEPRRTGDGYFESVISDPEGNLVEITI